MNAYEIIILGLIAVNLCVSMYKNGQPIEAKNYNFYKTFFYMMIQLVLFYKAGLFN